MDCLRKRWHMRFYAPYKGEEGDLSKPSSRNSLYTASLPATTFWDQSVPSATEHLASYLHRFIPTVSWITILFMVAFDVVSVYASAQVLYWTKYYIDFPFLDDEDNSDSEDGVVDMTKGSQSEGRPLLYSSHIWPYFLFLCVSGICSTFTIFIYQTYIESNTSKATAALLENMVNRVLFPKTLSTPTSFSYAKMSKYFFTMMEHTHPLVFMRAVLGRTMLSTIAFILLIGIMSPWIVMPLTAVFSILSYLNYRFVTEYYMSLENERNALTSFLSSRGKQLIEHRKTVYACQKHTDARAEMNQHIDQFLSQRLELLRSFSFRMYTILLGFNRSVFVPMLFPIILHFLMQTDLFRNIAHIDLWVIMGATTQLSFNVEKLSYELVTYRASLRNIRSAFKENNEAFVDMDAKGNHSSHAKRYDQEMGVAREQRIWEIRNIRYQIAGVDRTILENVNFVMDRGERVCLVGHTGCGKTTLLSILCNMRQATASDILCSPPQREIAWVPAADEATIWSNQTLAENLLYDCRDPDPIQSRSVQDKLLSVYEMLGLNLPLQERITTERPLSSGERQRILLGRALLSGKPILAMDEGLSALDEHNTDRVWTALDASFSTILYISHQWSTVRKATRVMVFEEGVVVENDSINALTQLPKSKLVDIFEKQIRKE